MFDKIAEFNKILKEKHPEEIIQWAVDHFKDGLYQTTSFGLSGLVIIDMLKTNIPLIFIDTLYNFQETLVLKEKVKQKYNKQIHVFYPNAASTRQEFERLNGERLWETNQELYDFLVKAEPAHRAYVELGVRAVFTGRRRSQGGERASLEVLELDESITPPVVKINPLASWDFETVQEYIAAHQIPYNELLDKGYRSVGDFHSTDPITNDQGERDGRWQGKAKTECGLHKDYFQLKIAAKKLKSHCLC